MSFIASLESSSLLPKIRSSLNIRTWEKQSSNVVGFTQKHKLLSFNLV